MEQGPKTTLEYVSRPRGRDGSWAYLAVNQAGLFAFMALQIAGLLIHQREATFPLFAFSGATALVGVIFGIAGLVWKEWGRRALLVGTLVNLLAMGYAALSCLACLRA